MAYDASSNTISNNLMHFQPLQASYKIVNKSQCTHFYNQNIKISKNQTPFTKNYIISYRKPEQEPGEHRRQERPQ